MSDFGAIEDALISLCRTAVPTIPAGTLGAEKGIRDPSSLNNEAFPHLFAHNTSEEVALLDFQQEQRTTRVQLSLVTADDDHAGLATKLDAIRDGIVANRTLTGIVLYSFVSNRSVNESTLTHFKEGVLEVTTVQEV